MNPRLSPGPASLEANRTELRGATGHGGVTPTSDDTGMAPQAVRPGGGRLFSAEADNSRGGGIIPRFVERCIDILERCADQAWLPRALPVADRGQVHDCTEVRGRQNITWAPRPRRNHYHINSSSPPLSIQPILSLHLSPSSRPPKRRPPSGWLLLPYPQNNRAPALTRSIAVHSTSDTRYIPVGYM